MALDQDLSVVLRLAAGRGADPTTVIFDSRTLPSTQENGPRVGFHGVKRIRDSKFQLAIDMTGPQIALHVTPQNVNARTAVASLAEAVQEVPTIGPH
jgi:hypothetical protein